MSTEPRPPRMPQAALRRPVRLTWVGLLAERICRAFWPLWSVLLVVVAVLMLGLHEALPLEALWAGLAAAAAALVWAVVFAVRRFRWPHRADADQLVVLQDEHPVDLVVQQEAGGLVGTGVGGEGEDGPRHDLAHRVLRQDVPLRPVGLAEALDRLFLRHLAGFGAGVQLFGDALGGFRKGAQLADPVVDHLRMGEVEADAGGDEQRDHRQTEHGPELGGD